MVDMGTYLGLDISIGNALFRRCVAKPKRIPARSSFRALLVLTPFERGEEFVICGAVAGGRTLNTVRKAWWLMVLLVAACGGKAVERTNRTELRDAGGRPLRTVNRDAGNSGKSSGPRWNADATAAFGGGALVAADATAAFGGGALVAANATSTGIPRDAASLGIPNDAPVDDRTIACLHSFLLMRATTCTTRAFGGKSALEQWPEYERECRAEFDLPGVTYTAADLEACNVANDASGCADFDLPFFECDFRGSLPPGAPCVLGQQCQSGACDVTSPPDGGSIWGLWNPCGTCSKFAAVGESCLQTGGPDSIGCEKGAECIFSCLAMTEGDAGVPCNGVTAVCRPGLFCSDSHVCTPFATLGEPCTFGRCVAPYVCGLGFNAVCEKSAARGEPCDQGCEPGLECDRSRTCRQFEWVGAGAPCDDNTRYCYSGLCLDGICSTTTVEGEPCQRDMECSYPSPFWVCAPAERGATEGVCSPPAAVACR
jgi:hypothetical protein